MLTTDLLCAVLANRAMRIAESAFNPLMQYLDPAEHCARLADRIIALRSRELAQALQS